MDENKVDIIPGFLRTLAKKIENNELSNYQIQKVSEFFLSYLFDNTDFSSKEEINKDDFMKFFILGWYIYSYILPT